MLPHSARCLIGLSCDCLAFFRSYDGDRLLAWHAARALLGAAVQPVPPIGTGDGLESVRCSEPVSTRITQSRS